MAKSPVELFDGWPANRPTNTHEEYSEHIMKAILSVNLGMLAEMLGQTSPKVMIQQKPVRAVFADADYPKAKLVLVPDTMRICATSGTMVPAGLKCEALQLCQIQ